MSAASTGEVAGAWSTPIITGKAPPARGGHSASLVGNLLVIYGGTYYGGEDKFVYLKDTWAVDTDSMTWHHPTCAGRAPGARYGHTATVVGTKIYVFGGKGEGGLLYNDLHCLDVERWAWSLQPSTTAPPLGRFGHAAVAVDDKIVVFGGWDGRVAFNDLWVYDIAARTWVKPQVAGPPPSPRHGHSLALAPDGNLLVFGGWAVSDRGHPVYLNDLRTLDTRSMLWGRSRASGDAPTPRYSHGCVTVGGKMVIFGGWGSGQAKKTEEDTKAAALRVAAGGHADTPEAESLDPRPHPATWILDMDTMVWSAPIIAGRQPGPRYGHATFALGPYILAFAGWDGVKAKNDLVQLDLSPLLGFLDGEGGAGGEHLGFGAEEGDGEEAFDGRGGGRGGGGGGGGGGGAGGDEEEGAFEGEYAEDGRLAAADGGAYDA